VGRGWACAILVSLDPNIKIDKGEMKAHARRSKYHKKIDIMREYSAQNLSLDSQSLPPGLSLKS